MKRDSWRPRLTTGQQGGDNTHTSYSWLRTEACTQTHARSSVYKKDPDVFADEKGFP